MTNATLENWSLKLVGGPFDPPECCRQRIFGAVYGHPRFEAGERVGISEPVFVDPISRIVRTRQTEYTLGLIDPSYAAAFEDAESRFWKSWSKQCGRSPQ